MPTYSIELDLSGRTVLVVGLGVVGARKATGLAEMGARVVGIDPAMDLKVPEGVEHRAEAFRPEHLEGAVLVFAASTPEVNRRVVAAAKAAGILVNTASEPASGDFCLPAVWRDGPITLTISTSGASPALARSLRDRASGALAGASELALLLAEVRPMVLDRIEDTEKRRRLLNDLGDARWLDVLASEGAGAVRLAWLTAIKEAAHGRSLPGSPGIS